MEQSIQNSLDPSQKQRIHDLLRTASYSGQDEFEDFTQRHSEMKYEEDRILRQQDERHRKFEEWKESDERFWKDGKGTGHKIVQTRLKKRTIEPEAKFGQFTSDIVTESGHRPTDFIEDDQT